MNRVQIYAIAATILAGSLIAVMARLSASLAIHIGVLESSFMAHIVGTVFAFFLIIKNFDKTIHKTIKLPKYLLLGGILGVIILLLSNIAILHLGMLVTIGLFITADLTFSTAADHFGLFGLPKFPLTARRITGLLITFAGLALLFLV